MSLHNTDIQGNTNISRNANVGGHANINGDVTVGHNMVVKGWLDAPNIKGTCKGLYASEAALKAAYPRPMPGWFALVGDTLPAQVWRAEPQHAGDCGLLPLTQHKWAATGEQGGQFTLWLDQLETDVKDLTDDVRDLEELLDNGLLLGETIEFTSTGTAAAMKFTIMKRDGSTKEHSKPIPIVTAEKAGMMSAADKKELSTATADIATLNEKVSSLETNTANLKKALDEEATARKEADEALKALIDKLRKDFDTMYGEDTSDKIDNFTEIIAFLEGVEDTETLVGKIATLVEADIALGKRTDTETAAREAADTTLSGRITDEATARKEADEALMERTSDIVVCAGFLDISEEATEPGTYLKRDREGDPVMTVSVTETGSTLSYPTEGKVYVCEGKGYIYNGFMLVPIGHHRMVFDGGTPATRTDFHVHLNGGTPATRAAILKQIDCGYPRNR